MDIYINMLNTTSLYGTIHNIDRKMLRRLFEMNFCNKISHLVKELGLLITRDL